VSDRFDDIHSESPNLFCVLSLCLPKPPPGVLCAVSLSSANPALQFSALHFITVLDAAQVSQGIIN